MTDRNNASTNDAQKAHEGQPNIMENSLFYLIADINHPALGQDQFDGLVEEFDVRCVLIEENDAIAADHENARRIISHIQSHDVAVLIAGSPDTAQALDADGVHLGAEQDFTALLARTNARMDDDAIKGVEVGNSRHDAMERAEKNIDYVAFAVDDNDMVEMISWWSDLFEIPCVAWKVSSPDMAAACSKAGADFIAIDLAGIGGDKTATDVLTEFKTALTDAAPNA